MNDPTMNDHTREARSDIVGTEYGWRTRPGGNVRPVQTREQAIERAIRARACGGSWAESEAVEYAGAWSVIPLTGAAADAKAEDIRAAERLRLSAQRPPNRRPAGGR